MIIPSKLFVIQAKILLGRLNQLELFSRGGLHIDDWQEHNSGMNAWKE